MRITNAFGSRLPVSSLLSVAALLATTFCSCQTLTQQPGASGKPGPNGTSNIPPARVKAHFGDSTPVPNKDAVRAFAAVPAQFAVPEGASHGHCLACQGARPTLPPSAFGAVWCGDDFQRPPIEEFVCNGGDQNVSVQVKRDWSVQGLHSGDTVVHYDTLDGKTVVEPSNDVCLYAPRFAAVRKVYGIVAHEQHAKVAGVESPVGAELSSDLGQPTTVVQPLQPIRKHVVTSTQHFRDKTRGDGIENAQRPATTEEQFLPFEDLAIIRRGFFDNSEKARLEERLLAAVTWTGQQGLQVLLDNRMAVEATGTSASQSVYVYELPPGKSRLRVVKIASKQNAKPGELVEFTLRFDNVGDQPIGNVTVIDKLHDRLEYVVDSARCSVEAAFVPEEEDGLARVLRWEIKEPLQVGEGGLIRFTCRVR